MFTGNQLKAGLALIGWNRVELLKHVSASSATVQRIAESKDRVSNSSALLMIEIKECLEKQGVIFLERDHNSQGPGVCLKDDA